MGFIYDLPDEVSGDVSCEARRESFVLYADGESIELSYDQVVVIGEYLALLQKDRSSEIEAACRIRNAKRAEERPHGASGDGELRPI